MMNRLSNLPDQGPGNPGVPARLRALRSVTVAFMACLAVAGLALPLGGGLERAGGEVGVDAAAPTAGREVPDAVQTAAAATVAAEPDPALLLLRNELTRTLASGAGRTGNWGVLAVSLERGDTLFSRGANLSLAPASNVKLFTTAGALHHLGPDFRFQTFLLTDGTARDGTLEGDLILYGTGDPSISDRLLRSELAPFRAFARALRDQGIHTVHGDVLGDGTFFEGPRRRPSWNPRDLNDWFAAPVSALSFNENMVTLQVGAARPGEPPTVVTQPAGALLDLENRARTVSGSPGQILMAVRDDPDDPIELRGQMGARQVDVWRRMTVSEPELFAASVFLRVLTEEGIRVTGVPGKVAEASASRVTGRRIVAPGVVRGAGIEPGGAGAGQTGPQEARELRTIAVHRSPPLTDLLRVVNRSSHNLFAELLLHAMGRMVEGDGSFDGGARVLTRYLVAVAGIRSDGLHIEDGSGLSRLNRAPPAAFVQLFSHLAGHPHGDSFWAAIPEAGNRRELGRMYRSAAAGNLRAKTGTIHRVSALSGIVQGEEGESIFFSIIANDVASPWAAKQVEDRIGIRLAGFARAPLEMPDVLPGTGGAGAGVRSADQQQDQQQDR